MNCSNCKHWGDGSGTGMPYDAGHMNYCHHPQITGMQHPSYGACGEPKTMVYDGHAGEQEITTRSDFGCVLFVQRLVSQKHK